MNVEFIPWEGGEMPVPRGTLVTVKHRSGKIATDRAGIPGRAHRWDHSGARGDIMGYFVVCVTIEGFLQQRHPDVLRDYEAYIEVSKRLAGVE